VSSPLLDVTIDGATGVLFNVTGGTDLTLHEVDEAARVIRDMAHPDVNLIFGAVMDPEMDDGEIQITVIATGFDGAKKRLALSHNAKIREFPIPPFDSDNLDIPTFVRRRYPAQGGNV
jgi:cell division protein FtsZ